MIAKLKGQLELKHRDLEYEARVLAQLKEKYAILKNS